MAGDDLGDRMKMLEAQERSRRFLHGLPIYARIDGRGFSKFTKGMERPYDRRMSDAMVGTTKVLVEQTHATIGYVQSDEISLVWIPTENGHGWFDGKTMKMTSVLAGLAMVLPQGFEHMVRVAPN
jgi:tRNA(His) guanylyltransferase